MQIVNKVGGANYRKEEKTIFSLSLSCRETICKLY